GEEPQADSQRFEQPGLISDDARGRDRGTGRRGKSNRDVPVAPAEMEYQHHAERSEAKTLDPGEHDVRRAGDKKEDDKGDRVQASPEVLHTLEIPEAEAVAQADLFGEVGDLPVLVDIGIQPVASVFGIRDGKEIDETWHQGQE